MHLNPSPIELTTAATDAALGLLSVAVIAWLAQAPARASFRKGIWIGVFGLLAVGSVLGTVAHGLALSPNVTRRLWQPLYLSLGLCVSLFFVGAIRDWRGERTARRVLPYAIAAGLLFFPLTQLADDFRIFIAYEAVAMVGTLVIYMSLWIARRSRDAALMTAGIALTLAAAAVQVSSLIVWPFDHNGLFHLVQIAGSLVIAGGLSGRADATHTMTTSEMHDLITRSSRDR